MNSYIVTITYFVCKTGQFSHSDGERQRQFQVSFDKPEDGYEADKIACETLWQHEPDAYIRRVLVEECSNE